MEAIEDQVDQWVQKQVLSGQMEETGVYDISGEMQPNGQYLIKIDGHEWMTELQNEEAQKI